MSSSKRISSILLLFTLLVSISLAYDIDDKDFPPCAQDKCEVDIHSDNSPLCWMRDNEQYFQYMSLLEGDVHSIPNACWRSNIFGSGGYLIAYPSAGGIIFLQKPLAVDLQYLGLPNTHDTERSPDQDDNLATRMLQLGAQWWPNWDLYFRHSTRLDNGIFYDYHYPPKVYVAFPSTGGVWVANFTQDEPAYFEEGDRISQSWLPSPPYRYRVKLQYTLTMDNKAEQLKDMGATFYNSLNEVAGIAKTIDEAITMFEPFKERLRDMEDDKYRRRFYGHEDQEEDEDTTGEESENSGKPRWGIEWLFKQLR